MNRLVLTVAILFSIFSQTTQAQNAPFELKIFDVEGFTRGNDDAVVEAWQLPIRGAYRAQEDEPAVAEGESDNVTRADFLVRMIRDAVGADSWEESGTFMRLNESGTRLVVRHHGDVVKKVQRFITSIASARRQTFQVEVLVLKATAGSLASLAANRFVIDGKRFAAIRGGKNQGIEVISSATAQAIDGQRVRIRDQDIIHIVGAQSPQIAQSATRTEPNIVKIPVGFEFFIRPSSLPNGKVNSRIQGSLSDGLTIEDYASQAAGVSTVQLPRMQTRKFTSSGKVAIGEGMVVGSVGSADGAPRFVVVRVTGGMTETPAFQGLRGSTRVYSAGFLVRPYLGTPAVELGWVTAGPRLNDSWAREDSVFSSDWNYFSPDSVYDLIRQSVTPRFWEDNLYSLELLGDQLWVTAGPEQHKGIAQLLVELAASRGRSLTMESFTLVVDRSVVENLRSAKEGDWLRQMLRHSDTLRLHSMVGAGETGSRVEWIDGLVFAYVASVEVDVAQGADIAVPSVEVGFSGLYLRLSPCVEGDLLGLDFRIELNHQESSNLKHAKFKSQDQDLVLPRIQWQQAAGHIRCRAGRYALLAEFGLKNGKIALVIARLQDAKAR